MDHRKFIVELFSKNGLLMARKWLVLQTYAHIKKNIPAICIAQLYLPQLNVTLSMTFLFLFQHEKSYWQYWMRCYPRHSNVVQSNKAVFPCIFLFFRIIFRTIINSPLLFKFWILILVFKQCSYHIK